MHHSTLVQWCWSPLARVTPPAVQPCRHALCWSGGTTPSLTGTTNYSGSLMTSSSRALSTWSDMPSCASVSAMCLYTAYLLLSCCCPSSLPALMVASRHPQYVLTSLGAVRRPVLLLFSQETVCCCATMWCGATLNKDTLALHQAASKLCGCTSHRLAPVCG